MHNLEIPGAIPGPATIKTKPPSNFKGGFVLDFAKAVSKLLCSCRQLQGAGIFHASRNVEPGPRPSEATAEREL